MSDAYGVEDAFPRSMTMQPGLTTREYFAAHAPVEWEQRRSMQDEARLAVQWADALIEELNK